MPSGRAARPRPRALLGFYGEMRFPPRCIDQRSSCRWCIARSAHFRLVASSSARLADGVSRGAHIEPRDVRVAAPFGEKAACDRPCSLHALTGGNCKLAGTLPRSESSCHFVFGLYRIAQDDQILPRLLPLSVPYRRSARTSAIMREVQSCYAEPCSEPNPPRSESNPPSSESIHPCSESNPPRLESNPPCSDSSPT